MQSKNADTRNLLLALVISSIILGMWQYFVELPRKKLQAEALKNHAVIEKQIEVQKQASDAITLPRAELIKQSPRLPIHSGYLHGTLSLQGLRFDDISLARYHETIDPGSPEVTLLSPAYDKEGYFAEIGWLAPPTGVAIALPDKNTLWTADGTELAPEKPLHLTWRNAEGYTFNAIITLDTKYMFAITQKVTDASGNAVPMLSYAYINRVYDYKKQPLILVHQGPISVYDGILKTISFKDISAGKQQSTQVESGGWVGISDKYWLSALIPVDKAFSSRIFSYTAEDGRERFQTDYSELTPQTESTLHFFAGAKELDDLDAYALQYNIPLFDRALDFGRTYFLTKPIFITLTFFHSLVGNFGLAIMLLTVLVKVLMYPMANKSYKSMAQMTAIRPKMLEIQQRYKDDRQKLNEEMIDLYKREKVNPASGCLPALIQIPVFLSLYNALYVTIEMRQAPFFGWIHDLSAPDPSNIFTLFGLLHWNPPAIMHLGLWPILMAITMFIQQSQSPPPPDPTQAQVIKFMPLILLFMFSSVASGLVIYWTWSNTISIVQQWHIKRKYAPRNK